MTAPGPLPEVRQCQDTTHFLYGATAVVNTTADRWGVMAPNQGGHWALPEDVATWAVIQPPGQMPPTPPADPEDEA